MIRAAKLFRDWGLTPASMSAYASTVVEQSAARIDTRKKHRRKAPTQAFFYACHHEWRLFLSFNGGLFRRLLSRRPCAGSVNPTQSAAIVVTHIAAVIQSLHRSTAMKTSNQSARHSGRTPLSYRSRVRINLQFIQSALCDQAMHLRNDLDAAARLRTIAGELGRVTDKIGGVK